MAKDKEPTLLDELFFERAVQTYLWAQPALNLYGISYTFRARSNTLAK